MSAALRLDSTGPIELANATMQALALVDQGLSYRDAAKRCGVHWSGVWQAAKRRDAVTAQYEAGEEIGRRLVAQARIATEIGLERILRDLPTCHERYVAPWTLAAARLAGMIDGAPAGAEVSPMVDMLLGKLSNRRASLEVTASLAVGPESAAAVPHTVDVAAQPGETSAVSQGCE